LMSFYLFNKSFHLIFSLNLCTLKVFTGVGCLVRCSSSLDLASFFLNKNVEAAYSRS